jgi:predicted N-formylglutamate amidohydrolase
MDQIFEQIGEFSKLIGIIFTVEHAANALPLSLEISAQDQMILLQHWGWDIGIADVTRQLVHKLNGCAILSRYSRLLCDLNRAPEDPSWIIEQVDDRRLSFNRNLNKLERFHRRDTYHEPYHIAIDSIIKEYKQCGVQPLLISLHSFAPQIGNTRRAMELGVLFDQYQSLAIHFEKLLATSGFRTALNQPYSAMDGLIYSAQRHGTAHQIPYLELEIRQDLIDTIDKAANVAAKIADVLRQLDLRRLAFCGE